MVEFLREIQLPLLAVVLLAAGAGKLLLRPPRPGPGDGIPRPGPAAGKPAGAHPRGTGSRARAGVRESAVLAVRERRGVAVVTGCAEGVLAVALLFGGPQSVRLLTVAWFGGAFWIVTELRARRPEAGCGCFGALSSRRIGRRELVRPLLLMGAASVTVGTSGGGLGALARAGGPGYAVLALEVLLVLVVSPELGVLVARARSGGTPCDLRSVPLKSTLAVLRASRVWREHLHLLAAAEPVEVWRERCWRFAVVPARDGGAVVFAVSLERTRRPEVRAGLVAPEPAFLPLPAPVAGPAEDTGPNPAHPVAV